MANPAVCAIVVTFRPEESVLVNLALIAVQVTDMVVVDNGSGGASLKMLRSASRTPEPASAYGAGLHIGGFQLLENGENLGIAAALNRGVKWALERSYAWVILFDQDSTVTPGLIEAMFAGRESDRERREVAIYCPEYIDRSSGKPLKTTGVDRDGDPLVAMTSGSLMPAWSFLRCGDFKEDLFIDQVDVEYCLRIRSLGYTVARSPGARLLHAAGAPRVHRFCGLRLFRATHHSAGRRYYITRNRAWIAINYRKLQKWWCIAIFKSIVADTIKLALVEDSKSEKVRNTLYGLADGFRGRLGKTREL